LRRLHTTNTSLSRCIILLQEDHGSGSSCRWWPATTCFSMTPLSPKPHESEGDGTGRVGCGYCARPVRKSYTINEIGPRKKSWYNLIYFLLLPLSQQFVILLLQQIYELMGCNNGEMGLLFLSEFQSCIFVLDKYIMISGMFLSKTNLIWYARIRL
jgi:hypothetical protein